MFAICSPRKNILAAKEFGENYYQKAESSEGYSTLTLLSNNLDTIYNSKVVLEESDEGTPIF